MAKIIKKTVMLLLAFTMVSFTNIVSAETDTERKEDCRKPRFRSIKPPHLSEVMPGSEFSFTLPVWSDPKKVQVVVKKLDVATVIEDHHSFFLVKVKLPAELSNTYARVDVRAYAKLDCFKRKGWLYKILGAEQEKITEPQDKQQQETEKLQPAAEKDGKPEF